MDARLKAIASMTGMNGVFNLQAAVVFEVLAVEEVPMGREPASVGETPPPVPPVPGEMGLAAIDGMTQLRALRRISASVGAGEDAETLLDEVLGILD